MFKPKLAVEAVIIFERLSGVVGLPLNAYPVRYTMVVESWKRGSERERTRETGRT
jgi:hypothetical protein